MGKLDGKVAVITRDGPLGSFVICGNKLKVAAYQKRRRANEGRDLT
jgi:hypothetical protein